MDKSRYININGQEYYLEECLEEIDNHCSLCELNNLCDIIADDINHIEYCLCLQIPYSLNHNNIYFKKVC